MKGELKMKSYIFRSLNGIGTESICNTFVKMLSDEKISVGYFNYNKYEWHIGVDVVQRLSDLRGWRPLPIETGPNSILGIYAAKSYAVKPNEIVLELKHDICEVDIASMHPRFMVASRGNGKSMMQLRCLEEMMKKIAFNKTEPIKNVIFNDPATVVYWKDNTKTVVKCGNDESFDPEKGLAMAISKKFLGNKGNYYEVFKEFLPKEEKNIKTEVSYNSSNTKEVCKTKNHKPDLKVNDIYKSDKFVKMGIKEYAEYCGVSESTIRNRIKNGSIKFAVKIDGKWIIRVNPFKKADDNE